jgi:cation:H+ antiporter
MSLLLSLTLFVGGLALVIFFAEKLVKGVVGTSAGFGVSAFVLSVVFIGFDPENLAVGAVGSYEQISGIALGSIIGAAMAAIAFAFGVTALVAPRTFERVPRSILAIPLAAVLLFAVLAWDGTLSRLDGAILLVGFVLAVLILLWLSRRGIDIRPTGEVAETLEEAGSLSRWKSLALMLLSLLAIIVGSELLVEGSRTLIAWLGLSDTLFGMTVLAFLVSVEEISRELPAALKGRSDISYGNVAGSLLAFFRFNAGIVALVRPVPVEPSVLRFFLPVCGLTVLAITPVMLTGQVPRWAGAILVLMYLLFVFGGYAGWEMLP